MTLTGFLRLIILFWLLLTDPSGQARAEREEQEILKDLEPSKSPDCLCTSLSCFEANMGFSQCGLTLPLDI